MKEALPKEEIVALEIAKRATTKYKGRGQTLDANADEIGKIVSRAQKMLELATDEGRRFELSDLASVNRIAVQYLGACAAAQTMPSVTGMAAALGRTRDALYRYARTHKDFGQWLDAFSDTCGEALAAAALKGAVNNVMAIFVLKSRHGWEENGTLKLQVERENPFADIQRTERDAARIGGSLLDAMPE